MAELISLPFTGRWLARNSPARRDWRTLLATEPPERFFSFGRPILAPADGIIVDAHDGETDHVGRRSQLTLVPYVLGQRARLRQGVGAIAGNHLVIALRDSGTFAALVHLRAGSLRVAIGDEVRTGQPIAECGNSGNSTQPHVHMQVMESRDLSVAQGVPMAFRRFREWPRGAKNFQIRQSGMPGEGSVVEPLPAPAADAGP
jgi:murein DD-endopeptidase MepM/ murein hydrolase activator NlpD